MTRTARNLAILIAYTLIAVGSLMGPDQAHGENPDPGTVADCVVDANGDYLCENPDDVAIDTPVDVTCTEDMSCWDCATMGNQQCGTPDYPTPSPDYPAPARPVPTEPAFTG